MTRSFEPMQRCPVCGNRTNANPRYPNYVCSACLSDGVTIEGAQVPINDLDVYSSPFIECSVNGISCRAEEAHLGGIVVSPIQGQHPMPRWAWVFPGALAFAISSIVWLAYVGGELAREAWDQPGFFAVGLPIVAASCFLIGLCYDRRAWMWGIFATAGPYALMVIGNPGFSPPMHPIVLFAYHAAPLSAAGWLGGLTRQGIRALSRRASS